MVNPNTEEFSLADFQVPMMNRLLRKAFVDLHQRKLLDELAEHFRMRYPDLELRDTPTRGDLDLNQVIESDYFFN